MSEQTTGKLKQLEHLLPEGLLVDAAWLSAHGYSTSLRTKYVASGSGRYREALQGAAANHPCRQRRRPHITNEGFWNSSLLQWLRFPAAKSLFASAPYFERRCRLCSQYRSCLSNFVSGENSAFCDLPLKIDLNRLPCTLRDKAIFCERLKGNRHEYWNRKVLQFDQRLRLH